MMRTATAGLLASVLGVSLAHAGTLYFTLAGTNPGGTSSYRGSVALTEVATGADGAKSGTVTWVVGKSAPVEGVVMSNQENPGRLSISFPGKPAPGVALGQVTPEGNVRVIWFAGGQAAGTEIWTRR